jgi:glycine dehydrogenase
MTINLSTANEFIARHIGPRQEDEQQMLASLGFDSLEALSASVIPESIKGTSVLGLEDGLSEAEALARIKAIASQNQLFKTYIGQGYYNCHTPSPILRNLLENPAWYTAYTPYQPEISQGRLEALLNFQTLISDLTGLPIANASLLDEATAAAEAMTFCKRLSKNKASNAFFASIHSHPQTLDVLRTRAEPLGIDVVVGDERELSDVSPFFGALLQYPASNGDVFDYRELTERFHAANALVAVAADLLALTVLTPPGEFGADVAIGSAQRFGVPLGFGGPHAAYFSTRDAFKRDMPGRLVGVSVDRFGKPALRLAMQTREQHIRREKATSNICTAQVLLANIASMYAVYHGPKGLTQIAQRIHQLTAILANGLRALGLKVEQEHFFDTLTLNTGARTAALHDQARAQRINLRVVDAERLGLSVDETTTQADIETLWALFADGKALPDFAAKVEGSLPAALLRQSPILTHPVFNRYHSETELMRYLRKLADKDLALDRTMIPLGSCTMKLNAASEMIPVTWAEFGALHPFAPAEQSGLPAIDLRPGSHALRGHRLRRHLAATERRLPGRIRRAAGDPRLSPEPWRSAPRHLPDPVVGPRHQPGHRPHGRHARGGDRCDARGNVDIEDLRAKGIEQHATTSPR